ncbi:hypothetical protein [Paenibacillus solani]|nr:hypothetical protein [Paenibacillus solani]
MNTHRMKRYMKVSLITLLLAICSSTAALASWAYPFVVNGGKIFVVTADHVDESKLGDVVGKVTYYSDREGTYSGNFSNIYPKGMKYYAIQGISSKLAIAVETQEGYVIARYEGEYEGARFPLQVILGWIAAGLVLLIVGCVTAVVFKKRADGSYRR